MRAWWVLALCAACGDTPPSGPDFSAGVTDMALPQAESLAEAQTLTTCLALDATHVYWVQTSGAVMRVAKSGGAAEQIAAGADRSSCLLVDGSGVYYTASTGGYANVMRAGATDGGTTVATMIHALPENKPFLALEGGAIFYVTDVPPGPLDMMSTGKGSIMRLVPGNAPQVVYGEVMGDPGGLAVDASSLFYSDAMGTFAVPRAGGANVSFGMSVIKRNAFVVSATLLALSEPRDIGAGDLTVTRKDGMQRTVVLDRLATPLALDDKGVYVNLDGHLTRIALDGKSQLILAYAQARAAAVDAGSVYFTDGAAILKVAR
jgi:hypothetical protein